ncbi:MAG: DNA-3-methyladenine glycosylase II [Granulosicoccus sp.]|jgi:DNA-3-methyladenine glycosylase II
MNKKFSISTPSDFNFKECLRFLQRSDSECLFRVENEVVQFALELEKEIFLIHLYWRKEQLRVEILKGELNFFFKKIIANYILEWFDVRRDLTDFNKICKKDRLLKNICQQNQGLRLIGVPSFLEAISWAIIGQQINLTFAYSLKKRLVENFGQKIEFEGKDFFLFPTAEVIAKLTEDDLRPHQFSRSKIKYLTGVGKAIDSGAISKKMLLPLSYEEAKVKLIEHKGVGNWTADYVLMKCLRCPDAFPITDVGIHNAIRKELNLEKKPSIESIEEMAKNWVGWKSYATFYLWHSLLVD